MYAATLFDNSVDFDEVKKDYFSHAYGDQWETVVEYLETIDRLMPQTYLEAKHTSPTASSFFNPAMEQQLLSVDEVCDKYAAFFEEHKNMPYRTQTVAMRLMKKHTEFCRGFAAAMAIKCMGKDAEAKAAAIEFLVDFGKQEVAMERYYDHMMARHALMAIFNTKSEFDQ